MNRQEMTRKQEKRKLKLVVFLCFKAIMLVSYCLRKTFMSREIGNKGELKIKKQFLNLVSTGKEKIGQGLDEARAKVSLLANKMVDLSKISSSNIEKTIDFIPSWVPVIPDYLKYQKRNSDVLTMMVTGYDASKGKNVEGGLGDRTKRALELQGEALVSGVKSVVGIFSAVITFGEGSVVGKSVEEVVEKVAKGEGPEMLIGSMSRLFEVTAENAGNEKAKSILLKFGKIWGYISSSEIAKGAIGGVLRQSESWQKIESISKDTNGRAELVREVKKETDLLKEKVNKKSGV